MSEPHYLPTREGYDVWSLYYDGDDNALIALEEPLVRQLLNDVRGLRVADVGCGTGRHAIPLAAQGAQVDAYDFSDGMLAKAKAKPGAERVNWIHYDVTSRLPATDACYDRVLSALVIDHVPRLGAYFSELRRVCRPNGLMVVTVVHPAMLLRGVTARFTDPRTQLEVRPQAERHLMSDYVMAILGAGLRIEQMSERAVDAALAARSERAAKYLDWPVLLLFVLRP
ncbi:MAG: methyltransferase domain-containing protein [Phycisphaerales bacterium]|nr:methyltransferase domain-containing protein [Phycisphaerales bacterium]